MKEARDLFASKLILPDRIHLHNGCLLAAGELRAELSCQAELSCPAQPRVLQGQGGTQVLFPKKHPAYPFISLWKWLCGEWIAT